MEGILVPILITLGAFAMVFGLRYLSNKENMAMIERGMDPRQQQKPRSRPLQTLKWGLILSGIGLGLFIAYYLDNFVLSGNENEAIYFGLIALFGGLGLVISYVFEKRHEEKEMRQRQP
jgi:hypothetical protein